MQLQCPPPKSFNNFPNLHALLAFKTHPALPQPPAIPFAAICRNRHISVLHFQASANAILTNSQSAPQITPPATVHSFPSNNARLPPTEHIWRKMSHCAAAHRRCQQRRPLPLLIIAIATLLVDCGVQAEIASGEAGRDTGGAAANSLAAPASNRCSARKFLAIANSIDDVEDLKLDVPVNIAFDSHQRKRFLLYLNASTPLTINFSQDVVRKIYFNQTTKLKSDSRRVLLPCALRGQYDIFVQAKQRGSVKIEAHALHAQASWPVELSRAGCGGARNPNRTNCVNIRSQNRVRKRQMIVKWDRSKFDFHAVQYCLVVNTRQRQPHFCNAVNDYVTQAARKGGAGSCYPGSVMDYIWLRPPERAKKIDPRITNIVCTGRRTQQLLKGVAPNHTYYLDVFGVHTQRHNLTFHIASAQVNFNRTHPVALRANALTMKKISGLHGVQVFSFKIPASSAATAAILHDYRKALPSTALQLRYLILPCGGSEVDAKILQQRKVIGEVPGIYRPIYIRLPVVQPGERYMVRFRPSNEDELLRANKVGLAVTTGRVFRHLPELPENITVFEVRTHCESTTIAWYSSPENRTMSYCIIVFNLPHRNRSSIDYTNYCMDFGKRVIQHPLFDSMKCNERAKSPPPIETHTIFNLTSGETYLIYVTANLGEGKPLPYQSLRVTMSQQCNNEIFDSREQRQDY